MGRISASKVLDGLLTTYIATNDINDNDYWLGQIGYWSVELDLAHAEMDLTERLRLHKIKGRKNETS